MKEAAAHPHNVARRSFVTVADVLQAAPTPRFSRTVPAVPEPAKAIGADTRSVLDDFGFAPGEVDALIASGALAEAS
jgi:alpha-methylacyl-CoA racemase